jgi:hypothetical protein
MKEQTKNRASFVLGVVAISTAWLLSWVSIIPAIIGLCLPKTEGHEKRDIALNVIAIVEGIIALCFWLNLAGY